MQRLRIQNIPNQQFNITLGGVNYGIHLRTVNRYGVFITLADIDVDGETVVSGQRCGANVPLIPYNYLTADGANFFFYCLNDDYPYYELFNETQILCYGTKEELAALWR